jgi:prevent-host-death family protein
MEVNIREARASISTLVERARKGEEVMILRRGKKVARLVPVESAHKSLPDLSGFRDSIAIKGGPLSQAVIDGRNQERY